MMLQASMLATIPQESLFLGINVAAVSRLALELFFWIQNSRVVALSKLDSLVYPTIYSKLEEEKRDWFMPFLRVLAQSEIQTALSKIWTCLALSISNDNNRFTMYAS